MRHSVPVWVRLPGGTYRLEVLGLAWSAACVAVAAFLMVSAIRLLDASSGPGLGSASALPSAAPAGPFAGEEPLSALFGLDRTPAASFVLLSTLLGPRPMATLAVGDTTIGVSVGDTLGGATVDSIGRRVVVLTRGGEVIRVAL